MLLIQARIVGMATKVPLKCLQKRRKRKLTLIHDIYHNKILKIFVLFACMLHILQHLNIIRFASEASSVTTTAAAAAAATTVATTNSTTINNNNNNNNNNTSSSKGDNNSLKSNITTRSINHQNSFNRRQQNEIVQNKSQTNNDTLQRRKLRRKQHTFASTSIGNNHTVRVRPVSLQQRYKVIALIIVTSRSNNKRSLYRHRRFVIGPTTTTQIKHYIGLNSTNVHRVDYPQSPLYETTNKEHVIIQGNTDIVLYRNIGAIPCPPNVRLVTHRVIPATAAPTRPHRQRGKELIDTAIMM
ncbi:uncharacterized protein ACN427_001608 [Glossina fuscipes fuscipes]